MCFLTDSVSEKKKKTWRSKTNFPFIFCSYGQWLRYICRFYRLHWRLHCHHRRCCWPSRLLYQPQRWSQCHRICCPRNQRAWYQTVPPRVVQRCCCYIFYIVEYLSLFSAPLLTQRNVLSINQHDHLIYESNRDQEYLDNRSLFCDFYHWHRYLHCSHRRCRRSSRLLYLLLLFLTLAARLWKMLICFENVKQVLFRLSHH